MKNSFQKPHRGILINKIPAKGVGGLLFTIGILAVFLIGLPQLRQFLLIALPAGALLGGLLYYWKNQTRW